MAAEYTRALRNPCKGARNPCTALGANGTGFFIKTTNKEITAEGTYIM